MATYHMWKDKAGKYYWVLKSDKNHETVAMSSEAYETFAGAHGSIGWTKANAKDAGFEDHT